MSGTRPVVNNINGMGILFHPFQRATITGLISFVYYTTLGEANLIHSLISSGLKLACGREVVTYKTQNAQSLEYSIK